MHPQDRDIAEVLRRHDLADGADLDRVQNLADAVGNIFRRNQPATLELMRVCVRFVRWGINDLHRLAILCTDRSLGESESASGALKSSISGEIPTPEVQPGAENRTCDWVC